MIDAFLIGFAVGCFLLMIPVAAMGWEGPR